MDTLATATRLYLLSLKARRMVATGQNKESRKKLNLLQHRFYPAMAELVLQRAMGEPAKTPSEGFKLVIETSAPARQVCLFLSFSFLSDPLDLLPVPALCPERSRPFHARCVSSPPRRGASRLELC